ncbi:MAG: hypothetical protein LBU73_08905 [Helicobacteraceae bacterium]|jgi:glycosyltransferase involved in cell wall biosynthesis|nr:hypothetical protein [Helicobacteraceae bacterium]
MKILFTITEDVGKEALWHATNLATALFAAGNDVRVAIEPSSEFGGEVASTKVPVEHILSNKSGFFAWTHQRATFRALGTRFKPTLVICYGAIPSGLSELKDIEVVSAVCGYEKFGVIAAKKAERVIVSSRLIAEFLESKDVPEGKIIVLRGGIDYLPDKTRLEYRAEERKRLGVDDSNILIGIIGPFGEGEGHRLILEGLTSDYHKNLKLMAIVDRPGEIDQFMNLCRHFNVSRVTLCEPRSDQVLRQLSALDIGVIADLKPNGVPSRVIELIAAKVRAVTTKIVADAECASAQNIIKENYPITTLHTLIDSCDNERIYDRASLLREFSRHFH